ncbi:hypothetical protein EOE67_16715 [Rheinheimera riviphila]|uniref:Uncharacterized protein n=1 Tax=Rheinheimera riviphila TaxID=1834037 RepID=A0A437QGR0_9GAMM|nr:hypothetical protein [Rheinheimera riviphila]RVU33500.1 hypothetical protein EOE67_16715 [Rheinheimera riviphila]
MKHDDFMSSAGIALIPTIIISAASNLSTFGTISVYALLLFIIAIIIESSKENEEKTEIQKYLKDPSVVYDNHTNDNIGSKSNYSPKIDESSQTKDKPKYFDIGMDKVLELEQISEILKFFRAGKPTTWLSISFFKYGDEGVFKVEHVSIEAASMFIRIMIEHKCSEKEVARLLIQKEFEIAEIIHQCMPDYPHYETAAHEIYLRAIQHGDINKPALCI